MPASVLADNWFSFANKKKKNVSDPTLILLDQLEENCLKKDILAKIRADKEDDDASGDEKALSATEVKVLAEYGIITHKNMVSLKMIALGLP